MLAASSHPKAPSEIDRRVGQRIAILRKARGVTQTALAQAAGITFQQVQKYENGHNRVGAGRLSAFAETLQVPVASFFAEEGSEAFPAPLGALSEPGATELILLYGAISDLAQRRALIAMARSLVGSTHATKAC